ncbi:MAG: transcription antitermination factor NusB [Gammaproteobacteria bacterium]|nr:transcription antitermination factor NusB [Gammaproteobacteria bacterium]
MSRRARHQARYKAVQAIYQADLGQNSATDLCQQFRQFQDMNDCDHEFFDLLVRGVLKESAALDEAYGQHLDRTVEELDPIERSVLRLAAYELKFEFETPYKVVINEAVELTKTFGAEGGHKYINGVLDKTAKTLRPLEVR